MLVHKVEDHRAGWHNMADDDSTLSADAVMAKVKEVAQQLQGYGLPFSSGMGFVRGVDDGA